MQCEQFENLWQLRLDAGEDPRLDEHLVAHSLCCQHCNELLEGTEYLLALEYPTASSDNCVANYPVELKHNRPEVPSSAHSERSSRSVTLASVETYRDSSLRWPTVAAALVVLIALSLWGRVWVGLAEPHNSVASAHRAAEESIAGVNSPRIASTVEPSAVPPWVPSPLQLAIRARETRYLINSTDPYAFNAWRTAIWENPPNSTQFWARGLEPLTSSWELAVQVIRNSIPLDWTVPGNGGYNLWTSPLEFASPNAN